MFIARAVRRFSTFNVPITNAEYFLSNNPKMVEECKRAVEFMHKTGVMILKDPRVDEKDNEEFLDLMESYYESKVQKYYKTGIVEDSNPQAG